MEHGLSRQLNPRRFQANSSECSDLNKGINQNHITEDRFMIKTFEHELNEGNTEPSLIPHPHPLLFLLT